MSKKQLYCSFNILQWNLISILFIFYIFRSSLAIGEEAEKVQLNNLIYAIEKELPFDALGLFNVDLTTLTSIFSSVMTYLVIMVQFNETEKSKTDNSTTSNEE